MLVKPKLDYAGIIWNSASDSILEQVEDVQKRLVNFVYNKYNLNHLYYEYLNICKYLNIQTLTESRRCAETAFIQKLINGNMNSAYLLDNLYFKVPKHSTRTHNILFTESSKQSPL